MQINGTYKLGYDLNELLSNPERVIINNSGGVVTIITPKIELISLELPFDKVVISDKDGWLRKEITDEEKQATYKQAKEMVVNEIHNNDELIDQAHNPTNEVLKEILMLVENVNEVKFIKG